MPITPATGSLADAATGFAGQYLDDATGLYDMRARDYDPSSGRFTATDPVAVPTGTAYFSGYTYGSNNPLMFTDPTGLFSIGDAWDIYKGGVRAYKDLILNDLALTQPNLGGWADKRRYDMARGFMLGVEEDGYWVQINESFNPALQALQSGDAAITAWQEGDYDGVGYNGLNTTVAVAATVGIACVVAKGATNVATKPTIAEPVPPVAKPPTTTPATSSTGPRFVATSTGIIDTASPALAAQIRQVVSSLKATKLPPTGVRQGGLSGQSRPGVYANKSGALPAKPLGYYTESDVWPGTGPRGTERIVIGDNGEVWYSPDHYGTFRSWP